MKSELKRITFALTPDMEPVMEEASKMLEHRSRSDLIRSLIATGLETVKSNKTEKENALS